MNNRNEKYHTVTVVRTNRKILVGTNKCVYQFLRKKNQKKVKEKLYK